MTKKDGPPSSGSGYRFGPLEAFRSGLPPTATNVRSPRTETELEAGEALAKFNDYFGRARSIGEPLPSAQGLSPERAASLQKTEESEWAFVPVATLKDEGDTKIRLLKSARVYMFVKERPWGYARSIMYSNRQRAMQQYYWDRVAYIKFIEGPFVAPIIITPTDGP